MHFSETHILSPVTFFENVFSWEGKGKNSLLLKKHPVNNICLQKIYYLEHFNEVIQFDGLHSVRMTCLYQSYKNNY